MPISEDTSHTEDSYHRGSIGHNTSMLFLCQRAVLCWLIAFTVRLKHKTKTLTDSKSVETISVTSDSSELTMTHDISPVVTPSNEALPAMPQLKHYDMLCESADIVRAVLYCTQENVLVVHELFRQV